MAADSQMQSVLDQMAQFEVPPIESLTPGNARNTPTFNNAVAQMTADSAAARAKDLTGLPPAIVLTAEIDPLRDEGEEYARRLADAGVSVYSRRFNGVTHEFFGLAGTVDMAKEAVKDAADGLKKIFDVRTTATAEW